MQRQRWYAAKSEPIERVTIAEHAMLDAGDEHWLLALADARGAGRCGRATSCRWRWPSRTATRSAPASSAAWPSAACASRPRSACSPTPWATRPSAAPWCGDRRGRELKAEAGRIRFVPTAAFAGVAGEALAGPTPLHRLTTSSNSVSLLGDRLFLKAYRRLQPGINPELEMGRFLTDVVGYANCVPVAGSVEYHAADGSVWTLALLQAQVANQGDAWSFTVDQLARLLESLGARAPATRPRTASGGMVERMQVLARRIAELHVALARRTGDRGLRPRAGRRRRPAALGRDGARRMPTRRWPCWPAPRASWPEPLRRAGRRVMAARAALIAAHRRGCRAPRRPA